MLSFLYWRSWLNAALIDKFLFIFFRSSQKYRCPSDTLTTKEAYGSRWSTLQEDRLSLTPLPGKVNCYPFYFILILFCFPHNVPNILVLSHFVWFTFQPPGWWMGDCRGCSAWPLSRAGRWQSYATTIWRFSLAPGRTLTPLLARNVQVSRTKWYLIENWCLEVALTMSPPNKAIIKKIKCPPPPFPPVSDWTRYYF